MPDGTHDSYDAVSGVLTKRVGTIVYDGSADESWIIAYPSISDTHGFQSFLTPLVSVSSWSAGYLCISDKFKSTAGYAVYWKTAMGITTDASYLIICISDTLAATASAFKAWLAANPVTVYYKLATPTTVQLTPHLPVVRTGIKTLTVGADVVPTISATVKSMD